MSNRIEEVSVPAGTRMRIGVPAEQPEAAIEALVRLFSKTDNVLSARLGLMEILHPDGHSQVSYTIGIQCSSDEPNTTQQALNVLRFVPTGRWPISVVPPTDQYFTREAIVFFRRNTQPKSWLSRLFGGK